jgi:hypothetical protein
MEIKSGTSTKTGLTVSQSFAYCYNLRASSTTLGNNTLDPHLTLNSDWGAVLYLAASVYGVDTTTNDTIQASTTGNESGVKNLGANATFTSSLFGGIVEDNSYRINLEKFVGTKYVESTDTSNSASSTRGQAIGETSGWNSTYNDLAKTACPVTVRKNAFGNYSAQGYKYYLGVGRGNDGNATYATFRPVIWN